MGDKEFQQTDRINSVLITGGGGLVGGALSSLLLSKGYKVSHLSGRKKPIKDIPVYEWSPEDGSIDSAALLGVDCIVHLAGANIGEKRWTDKRKEEILKSRVDSVKLLYKTVSDQKLKLKAFISASAIGYYGSLTSDKIFSEEDNPANDFLGNTCRLWEKSADLFATAGIRTVKIRTGIVLDIKAGALTKLYKPASYGFVIRTGSGRQYMPWIHIWDLCNIYLKAIEDEGIEGPYNAAAPEHTDHDHFVRVMAKTINRHVILPPVPSFILQILLGEMSCLILNGSRISSKRISESGYTFVFHNLEEALNDLFCK
jgi:uncharacterized protein